MTEPGEHEEYCTRAGCDHGYRWHQQTGGSSGCRLCGCSGFELDKPRDAEGFTAAERAESLARAERVYGTLPTPEQLARSKAEARGRRRPVSGIDRA